MVKILSAFNETTAPDTSNPSTISIMKAVLAIDNKVNYFVVDFLFLSNSRTMIILILIIITKSSCYSLCTN